MEPKELDYKEIWRRISMPDAEQLKTMLAYARDFYDLNFKAKDVLDEKALKYFGLAATLLALLSTLGSYLAHLLAPMPLYPVVAILGGACLLGACVCFFQANRPRFYNTLSDFAILDEHGLKTWSDGTTSAVMYDRIMVRHFLEAGKHAGGVNAAKREWMRRGERLLIAGLGFILLVLATLSTAIAAKGC